MHFQLIFVSVIMYFSITSKVVDKCTLLICSTRNYILLLMLCSCGHGKVFSMQFLLLGFRNLNNFLKFTSHCMNKGICGVPAEHIQEQNLVISRRMRQIQIYSLRYHIQFHFIFIDMFQFVTCFDFFFFFDFLCLKDIKSHSGFN